MTRYFTGIGIIGVLCCSSMAQGQQCTPPPSGLVTWYTGDGTANDFVGTNHGTPQNGASFAAGKVGQAFNFNGTNQFISLPTNLIPYPTSGTSSQPMSVDAWFQTTTGGVILGQQGVFSPPSTPNGAVPAIYVGTDGFLYASLFWKGAVTPVSSAPNKVNNGVFHHVAVTYDGVTEAVYLDGGLLGSMTFTQVAYAASYQYQIGAGFTLGWPAGNGNYFYFQGLIDEVEFFNRALSQTEVQAIVNAGSAGKCKTTQPGACTPPPSGLVTWLTGDGTANDFLGTNNGTPQNGASFAAGKVGQAFSVNGTNQFISLPTNVIPYPATGASSTQPMTVDAWFLTSTGGVILGQQGVFSPPAAPSGTVPAIYVGTDGFLYASLFSKGVVAPLSSAPNKVNNGIFHHVAVTYDGVTETVYLDGGLVGSMPFTQIGYAASYQYQIGAGFTVGWPAGNANYFYFQGLIDEVEFFNRALSQAEVQAIVNAGSAGKCKNQPPVAQCKSITVSACVTNASIDNGSFDPGGNAITLSQSPLGPYAVGATMVTLTVSNNHGGSSQCSGTVTVTNAMPSTTGSLIATPNVLWPPNGKLIPVTIAAEGGCSAGSCKIVSVASSEAAGQGDWLITGDLTVNLRAERAGNGDGRVYTITVQCSDAAGIVTTKTVTVTVPHDQGNGDEGDDDGKDTGGGHGKGNRKDH